jgi:hypothetical protein
MEGLPWLLGFGLLFYVMMRYGYGYGWYFAQVWAPLNNFFAARSRL